VHAAPRSRSSTEANAPPVELGRVERPHGRDGALLVVLHGDDPANLLAAPEVTLAGDLGEIPFRTRAADEAGATSAGHARVRLSLEGLDSRERAERWRGARVLLAEDLLAELPPGEYYWRDLIGCSCRLPDGTAVGRVEEIWPTGGHDVLVLRDGARRRLVPTTDEVLVRFDRERGELWIDPPEGLLDDPPEFDGEAE
jgi:16S rRNA processing protein RimM